MENALSDSLQHAPRLQDKSRQHNSTQIRAGSQLRDDMRQYYSPAISATLLWNLGVYGVYRGVGRPHHFPDRAPRRLSRPPGHPTSTRRPKTLRLLLTSPISTMPCLKFMPNSPDVCLPLGKGPGAEGMQAWRKGTYLLRRPGDAHVPS